MGKLIYTIILGIIEGVTEWLPISSTGHLILAENLSKVQMSADFMELFNVVIQLGAILAVVVLFFNKLWPFHGKAERYSPSQFAHPADGAAGRFQNFADNYLHMDRVILWCKIAVSVLPAIVIGLPLDDWLDEHMHKPLPVAIMLILYGVLFILIENSNYGKRPRVRKISQITWKLALMIGFFQVLALIPGTSRSGATILGGLLLGFARPVIAEYTFYLAIPTMLGASLLKLVKFGRAVTSGELSFLLIGTVVAFVVSFFVIRLFMSFVRRHSFKVFGWYRIALGAVVLICLAIGVFK